MYCKHYLDMKKTIYCSYYVLIMETKHDANNLRRNFELLGYDGFDCSRGLRFITWPMEEKKGGVNYSFIEEV
jgi:hypothetical protein